MKKAGKSVLVIDKRPNIAGNVYTEEIEGINVHKYGAHIFHTNNKSVWNYVNQFAEFNRFTNSPVANYHGELYSLPFNMYTFNKMWGVVTPEEAEAKIEEQKRSLGITEPKNLEEQAISLVGTDIYEKLIKGYTENNGDVPATSFQLLLLSVFRCALHLIIIILMHYIRGFRLADIRKWLQICWKELRFSWGLIIWKISRNMTKIAETVIYTGAIDAYFGFKLGTLEYRSVRFETEVLDKPNFQGNAAVNYTDAETHGPELLNISGLSLARSLRPLSVGSTVQNGHQGRNLIIL